LRIDVHALNWNELRMLPFFLRHYLPFVDRIFLFDDGSDDGSLEYLRGYPQVVVERVPSGPDSFIDREQLLYNTCWKRSRGRADWVITPNIDEHLYHSDLFAYLEACRDRGVTAIPALGYQMISESFPRSNECLCDSIQYGMPWRQMNKLLVFDPHAIEETNFSVGIHKASPVGRVVYPDQDELLLLHYKYLGLDYLLSRHAELGAGLTREDVAKGRGHKYVWSKSEVQDDFEDVRQRSRKVVGEGCARCDEHGTERWWRS
jgi:hypothetical protein